MNIIRTQEGAETWDRAGALKECSVKYLVTNPPDKQSALEAVRKAAPEKVTTKYDTGSMLLSALRFDGYTGDGAIEITVQYIRATHALTIGRGMKQVASFDCSGSTKHVTHAINQKRVYPEGEKDDSGGAIGWNGKTGDDLQIEGCDIPVGQLRETYAKEFKISNLTTARKRLWGSMVGKINNAPFKGWEKGEVMFLGCSFSGGTYDPSETITVQFNFAIQVNEKAEIADGACRVFKHGFQVIWARSESDMKNRKTASKVKGVYLANVAQTADFDKLGI